jgi:hypothetical protein
MVVGYGGFVFGSVRCWGCSLGSLHSRSLFLFLYGPRCQGLIESSMAFFPVLFSLRMKLLTTMKMWVRVHLALYFPLVLIFLVLLVLLMLCVLLLELVLL